METYHQKNTGMDIMVLKVQHNEGYNEGYNESLKAPLLLDIK